MAVVQIEVRLMAHFSAPLKGSAALTEALGHKSGDPFRQLASHWYKCAPHQVRVELTREAANACASSASYLGLNGEKPLWL
jgi:hypothetical protein